MSPILQPARSRNLPLLTPQEVEEIVLEIFSGELHAKRCSALASTVVGAMHADALSIHELGRAQARVRRTKAKHAIKQVDRLLSNEGIDLEHAFRAWIRWLIGARDEIVVAIDWTEYADDEHHRVAIHLVTGHGRATPLVWKTVLAHDLRDRRSECESDVLDVLRRAVPRHVRVTVLGDRAFGDCSLYEYCDRVLKFDYVFRFRQCIRVVGPDGDKAQARDWVPGDGTARRVDDARVTGRRYPVAGVVCVHAQDMKDAWCLATSRDDEAGEVVGLYGRRFTIEESFRDEKDIHFGMGSKLTHIGDPVRRDRLLLVLAVATALLTLVGNAGERTGAYRDLKANTSPRRQHSLFWQGREYLRGLEQQRYQDLRVELGRQLHARWTATFGVV